MKTTKPSKQQIALIKKSVSAIGCKSNLLPILECAYISGEQITLTDLQTTVIIKNVGIEGQFVLPVKNLLDVLSLLPEFTTVSNEAQVTFTSPDNSERFKYNVDSFMDFPKVPNVESAPQANITPADHARIQTAVKFISTDELRPAMCHVCLHDGEIAATNAHLLYWEASDLKLGSDLLLNPKTIKLMEIFSGAGGLALSIGKTHFKLENEAVVIIQRDPNENYPNYREILPTAFKTSLTVDKKPFVEAITKADKMANNVTHLVKFDIGEHTGFKLSAEDIDFGTEYNKDLTKLSTISGFPIEIGFNAKFVLQVCSLVDADEIKINMGDANRATVFNGNILVMPVMLKQYV